MADIDLSYAFGLTPKNAVEYFESKGYVLGFNWQDVAAEAHAKAFTVAGVMKVDVLQDIRNTLADALKKGSTLERFKDDLIPTLQRKGWWGGGQLVDPETGEIQGKRLTPRRLETIFQTNLQSAYHAGRFKTQMEQIDTRPYWEYVAILDNRTRPAHAALNGEVYRYDDPFWATFYPPNGWNCRCRVRTRTAREVGREGGRERSQEDGREARSSGDRLVDVQQPVGRSGKTQPAIGYTPRTGGKAVLPDAGFGFNPGREWQRPFTPPPLDNLPRSFAPGVSLPELPTPAPVPASRLLARGLPEPDYAQAFLHEFGLKLGESRVFEDAAHAPLVISEDLFKTGTGEWKADKDGRGPFMRLLAQAVKDPDEIWLRWEERRDNPGTWLLKRRFIKSWEIAGSDPHSGPQYGLSVFEYGQDGWNASTAMMANADRGPEARRRYIEKQRDGFLAYRRKAD